MQDYVRQLVEQVLFTSPGERVNLPDFGSGLLQLPFAPNSVEMAAATQFAVQGALQKWLSGYIKVQSVVASAQEAVLTVTVTYRCSTPMSPRCRPSFTEVRNDLHAAATKTARPRCSAIPRLNGIDYLEVLDDKLIPASPRSRRCCSTA